jgi:chromosome segregation ATPase
MAKTVSLDGFAEFIDDSVRSIASARHEVEEVQVGFNSAYVEWKAPHDATLAELVNTIDGKLEDLGEDLHNRVELQRIEERAAIDARFEELESTLIPQTQAEADQMLEGGRRLTAELRELNPRLDHEEENFKAQREAYRAELESLNEEIRRLSGCFVVVFNFFKLNKLDKQRQKLIGQLQVVENHLRRVRQEWEEAQSGTQSQQDALKVRWQELTLKVAEMQGERDHLSVMENRARLARRRAIRRVVDDLKEDVDCPDPDVKAKLDHMVELNFQTDEYEEGLKSVMSLLAMMDGVAEGMRRFGESVDGLREEQRMHGSNLPKLSIAVPDSIVAFHQLWPRLAKQVVDERHLAANPGEFIAMVQPVIEDALSDDSIDAMFTGLGQALEQATSKWRG